ncbi:MAG: hypothetical protein ILP19_09525, partial [Oscillospiraceae bacterium]|nr:hypothetical protein [Oscillospiraceae bacterium]
MDFDPAYASNNSDVLRSVISLVLELITYVGLWKIFTKCGKKGWHAIVPMLNFYQLGCIANREKAARRFMVSSVAYSIIGGFLAPWILNMPDDQLSKMIVPACLILISFFVFLVMNIVMGIQIYLGLCDRFQRSRKWILLWIFAEPLVSVIWGFGKSF